MLNLLLVSAALGPAPASASGPSPQGSSVSAQPASDGPQAAPKRIRVAGTVEMAKQVYHPAPEYPEAAKRAGLEGVVRMEAIIGTDGRIKNLKVVSGESLLADAAQKAVSQWRYRPTTLNGVPVEVQTEIDVNFQLSGLNLVHPHGINAPVPTYHPDPPYTDKARRAGLEGSITLSVGVDEKGNVTDVREVSKKLGDGLDKSAILVVKTWRFQPATHEGKPVPVHVAIDLKFHLPDPRIGQASRAPQG